MNRITPILFFKNIWQYRELMMALLRKDISARYKQSVLGPAWALFQPVVLMGLFTIIQVFLNIPSEGIPYPIFVYSALLPWTFFSNSILYSTSSIVSNSQIIRKIYFPREIFPFSAGLASTFDFCMASIVYVALMLYYGIGVSYSLLLLPILLVIQIALALGISLLTSSIAVFRRDIMHAMPVLLQFWMFMTPVMYPLSTVPEKYRGIYMLNPMAGIIDAYRSILVKQSFPDAQPLLYAILGASAVFVAGLFVFKKLEMKFADVV